ncbi:MAG TPA: hydrogenase maturation protease [Spirochaetota bacterium]|nr:hydrogenase maturation protease [Spirochaetota bacterium]HPJ40258.1 hydrogenase maturation protease [Spirochaetota bacterium]
MNQVLIYGFGNPGRQDDGLGPEVVRRLESEHLPGVITDSNYQLNIEDAVAVAESDAVIFVDAALHVDEPFAFCRLTPASEITFTTHAMSPESVLALCEDIYGKIPPAYILAIKGYEWEMATPMTEQAKGNLEQAYSFIRELVLKQSLQAFDENAVPSGCLNATVQ